MVVKGEMMLQTNKLSNVPNWLELSTILGIYWKILLRPSEH